MLRNAIACFFGRHLAKGHGCIGGSLRHRGADAVHFGLGGGEEFALRVARLHSQRAGFLNGEKIFVKFGHSFISVVNGFQPSNLLYQVS